MTEIAPARSTQRITVYSDYLGDAAEPPPPPPGRIRPTKEERMEIQRKKQIAFRKVEITEHLKREVELGKKSVRRGEQLWLKMCRPIKLLELREEFKYWEKNAKRLVKDKDAYIKTLFDNIAEAKQMHKRGFEMRMQTLEYLKDAFRVFQNILQSQYEVQCEEMLHDFYNNIYELSDIQNAYTEKIQKLLNANNASLEHQLFTDFYKFTDEHADAVNTEIVNRYKLRDSTKKKMDSLHKQVLEFVDLLLHTSTDDLKYEKANLLMQRHRNFVTHFNKLDAIDMSKTTTLQKLRKELAHIEARDQRTIRELTDELGFFREKHKAVQKQMEQNKNYTHQKLRILTTECHGITKSLAKLTKHANLLGSLAANCRKLQTQSEKVTVFGDFQEPSQEQKLEELNEFKLKIIDLKSDVDFSDEELLAHMQLMKQFWRRQALAEAQILLLEKRKRELLIENQLYTEKIKSLGKTEDVADLKKALKVKCILKKKPCI